jgi:hypothetical protein
MERNGNGSHKIFGTAETIVGWYSARNKNEKTNALTSCFARMIEF